MKCAKLIIAIVATSSGTVYICNIWDAHEFKKGETWVKQKEQKQDQGKGHLPIKALQKDCPGGHAN